MGHDGYEKSVSGWQLVTSSAITLSFLYVTHSREDLMRAWIKVLEKFVVLYHLWPFFLSPWGLLYFVFSRHFHCRVISFSLLYLCSPLLPLSFLSSFYSSCYCFSWKICSYTVLFSIFLPYLNTVLSPCFCRGLSVLPCPYCLSIRWIASAHELCST
jgi:hypothetical protein